MHRSPFSGRNFEYYSEDGLLSGKLAANVIQGAKSKGVYTFVKHFALNDQETCRDANGVCTWADEQTMREIYFKAFEFAVKEGKTTAMMCSFNRIGNLWTGANYNLLTRLLRDEWGFKGTVVSDFNVLSYSNEDQFIRAGGDLNLSNGKFPATTDAAFNNTTYQAALRRATKNVLYTVAGSNAMNGHAEGLVWSYAMPVWCIIIIVVDCLAFAACCVWGIFAVRKAVKNAEGVK